MPSPPAIDQAIRFARRATPWVVGPIVFVLRGPTTDLAPASRCGGALDLLSMVVVGARPSLYVGTLFTTFQAVALILAFGFLGSLVLRTSGSLAIALAVTAALAISQPFDSGLALPASAMAFAACAAAALVLRAWTEKGEHHRSTLRACAAVFVAASIVPAWTTMCAFLTFGLVARGRASEARRRRVLIASIAAAVSVGVPVGIAAIVNRAGPSPRVASCVLPGSPISFASLSNAVDATGPLVLALAALGGYAVALGAGLRRTAALAGIAFLTIVPSLPDVWPRNVALAPALVAIWCLAGLGLREMLTRLRQRRTIASGLLIAILPALQLSRVHEARDDRRTPLGHERASLAQIRRLLNLMPPGSTLVEEDASVDLLLRAASLGGRQSSRPLAIVPLTRTSMLNALNVGGVFAFPAGQRDLGLRGFVLEPVAGGSKGLAAVSGTRACIELTREWTNLDATAMHGRIALVADSPLASGPVVIYFSGTDGYTPGPDNWPSRAMPGFDLRMFDRSSPETSAVMDSEANAVHLSGHAVFAAPHVARLTLFRTPGAPAALPIILGPPRTRGVGRLIAEPADALPLTVCDAPRVSVSEF